MGEQSLFVLEAWQICLILFAGIISFALLGYKAGKKSRVLSHKTSNGFEISRTGLMTLLSLILAFTLSTSGERYHAYKKVLINEVNCINSASQSSDLYPEPYRSEFRKYFLEYMDARILFFEAGTDFAKINESKEKYKSAGKKLWDLSSSLFEKPEFINASRISSPSILEMIDAATTTEASLRSKVPFEIPLLIYIISFILAYLGGYGSTQFGRNEWLYLITFGFILTIVTYIILDLDRPDTGFIKSTVEENALIDLKTEFIKTK